jgi:hypothetical protein
VLGPVLVELVVELGQEWVEVLVGLEQVQAEWVLELELVHQKANHRCHPHNPFPCHNQSHHHISTCRHAQVCHMTQLPSTCLQDSLLGTHHRRKRKMLRKQHDAHPHHTQFHLNCKEGSCNEDQNKVV